MFTQLPNADVNAGLVIMGTDVSTTAQYLTVDVSGNLNASVNNFATNSNTSDATTLRIVPATDQPFRVALAGASTATDLISRNEGVQDAGTIRTTTASDDPGRLAIENIDSFFETNYGIVHSARYFANFDGHFNNLSTLDPAVNSDNLLTLSTDTIPADDFFLMTTSTFRLPPNDTTILSLSFNLTLENSGMDNDDFNAVGFISEYTNDVDTLPNAAVWIIADRSFTPNTNYYAQVINDGAVVSEQEITGATVGGNLEKFLISINNEESKPIIIFERYDTSTQEYVTVATVDNLGKNFTSTVFYVANWCSSTANLTHSSALYSYSLRTLKTYTTELFNNTQYFNNFLRDFEDIADRFDATLNYDTGGGGLGVRYFKYIAPRKCTIARMLVTIEDAGIDNYNRYGDIAALDVGIHVYTLRNGDDIANANILTEAFSIKSNGDWGTYCFDSGIKSEGGGNDYVLVRWTFEKAGVGLNLNQGDEFGVIVNDNMSGLAGHKFQIQGNYS